MTTLINVKKSNAGMTTDSGQMKPKLVNLAMIGSGWQRDSSPFVNITFDRNSDLDAVMNEVKAGRRLSLQPLKKADTRFPDRKFVLVLRGEQV